MTLRDLRAALSPFRAASLAVRAHVAARWLTCPFDRVTAAMPAPPPGARVLDYGCGHGVFTHRIAAAWPDAADVLGVDIDGGKIAVAATTSAPTVRFEQITPGTVPEGVWDAIVVVDVVYLLSDDVRIPLLGALAEALAPGGALVMKEMAADARTKAALMRMQERLAVRVFRVTEGDSLAFTDARRFASALEQLGLDVWSDRIDRGYPHPHHLVVARKR